MQRREFLQVTLGAVAGTVSGTAVASMSISDHRPPWIVRYEQALADSSDLELLGIPRSWRDIHHGLHPFSPERVVRLPDRPDNREKQDLQRAIFTEIQSKPEA